MSINSIGNAAAQTVAPSAAAPPSSPPPVTALKGAAAVTDTKQQTAPNKEQVEKAVESIEKIVEVAQPNSLQFSIDDDSGKTIVRVTDTQTGEMIRQIPSEELLEIARSLDKLQGMLMREKA